MTCTVSVYTPHLWHLTGHVLFNFDVHCKCNGIDVGALSKLGGKTI